MQKLKIFIRNKNHNNYSGLGLFVVMLVFIFQSCSQTRYVPEGEYLLQKNKLKVDRNKDIDKSEMQSYIKQSTNNEILGVKLKLWLYNRSNIDKDLWIHKWLRKIGEEPVIFDKSLERKSVQQLKSYLNRRGYFDASINDTVLYKRKKALVRYQIQANDPSRIRNVIFDIQDPVLSPYILSDSSKFLLKSGDNYNVEVIDKERDRIETILKNSGFYNFNKGFVSFIADSTIGNKQIDITIVVNSMQKVDNPVYSSSKSFRKYKIRNVNFLMDYDPKAALETPTEYFANFDTIFYKGYSFSLKSKKPPLDYDVVLRSNYIIPGGLYKSYNTQQTKLHLGGLNMIKLVDIYYTNSPNISSPDTGIRSLDCHILLAPSKLQTYSIELEGTNSSGNFGASVNLIYQHRNLFRKAEVFNMKLKNSFESVHGEEGKNGRMVEVALGANIVFPRFLVPFLKKEGFVKKYNPKTSLFTAYSYQRRPDYTRTVATASFGYNWQVGNYISHIFTPIDLNIVKLPHIDSAFAAHIDTTSYLAYSYKDAFIAGGNYSFILTNQTFRRKLDYYFLRINLSTSGNLINLANSLFNKNARSSGDSIFGIEYSQFFMWDVDLRYHKVVSENSSIVGRAFVGVGIPYGNSRALPFARQYYTGGANDIRAWQVRSLGPGSYILPDTTLFYNQTADMKIVANLEYRFNLFWVMEGALFFDVGNIWSISKSDDREGAQFEFDSFLNQMAVGSGLGVRFDFSFFIFRLDLGVQMKDPRVPDWFTANYYKRNGLTLNFAVGYPF
ncbi:MAG: BamA/TamA family outer membrane protein [Bacteroidales bacterium]|nr:BamA/TamA family outer membrane protein [Bacteroidales bacterium]